MKAVGADAAAVCVYILIFYFVAVSRIQYVCVACDDPVREDSSNAMYVSDAADLTPCVQVFKQKSKKATCRFRRVVAANMLFVCLHLLLCVHTQ